MAYKNDEDKKKYHKDYYRKNKHRWILTPEQREEKRKYSLKYNRKNLINESKEKQEKRLRKQREWYYKNMPTKEERRSKALMCRYGLSVEDYDAMFKEQYGCCAICGKHQSDLVKRLHVDHRHSDEEIRGLLCQSCNLTLGRLENNWNEFMGYLSVGFIGNRRM